MLAKEEDEVLLLSPAQHSNQFFDFFASVLDAAAHEGVIDEYVDVIVENN